MLISEKKLFQLLVEPGYIEKEDFLRAQKKHQQSGESIGRILIDKGLILDEQLGQLVAEDRNWPFINLRKEKIDEKVLNLIPELMARTCRLLVFSQNDKNIFLAMANPDDFEVIHNLEKRFDREVKAYYATDDDISQALRYYKKNIRQEIITLVNRIIDAPSGSEERDLSVIKIVDLMIEHGYYNRTSDIHIEPLSDRVGVRFRIDGVMHNVVDLPWNIYESIVRRIKILSHIRTDEQRSAQDGKFKHKTESEEVDVRVSVVPVTRGENIVLRLLSNTNQQISLENLGLRSVDFKTATSALSVPHGMILVTGPTGSGKTTTLYEFIKAINNEEIHIASIEDPVEYDIEGVSQIQVNSKANLTFAKGLRAIVRQDPDVIMVGEIRDQETAKIAVNSAMTGHLVLSTLHTNDSATTLPRLLDMGVEPYLIASTVNIVIAQRLARKICEKCRYSYTINQEEIEIINRRHEVKKIISEKMNKEIEKLTLFKGEGCRVCGNSGYSGRIGIFEILTVSEEIKNLIMQAKNSDLIMEQAIKDGMTPLIEDGLIKAFNGVTTIEEVLRVSSGLG